MKNLVKVENLRLCNIRIDCKIVFMTFQEFCCRCMSTVPDKLNLFKYISKFRSSRIN